MDHLLNSIFWTAFCTTQDNDRDVQRAKETQKKAPNLSRAKGGWVFWGEKKSELHLKISNS